jgi:CRP-like cAMP-binding protein
MISEKVRAELQEETLRELGPPSPVPAGALLVEPSEALTKVPMFRGLGHQVISTLVSRLHPRSCRRGVTIIEADRRFREMFLIGRGAVRLEIRSDDGRTRTTDLRAGDFFGELDLITSTRAQVSAVAITPCNLLVLTLRDFDRVSQAFPELRQAVAAAYKSGVLVDLLAAVPFLAMLRHDELAELATRFEWVSFAAGQVVFRHGDRGTHLYVVSRGIAGANTGNGDRDGPERELGEGEFFGELAILGDQTRRATVTARTDLEALAIKVDDLLDLLERFPSMRERTAETPARPRQRPAQLRVAGQPDPE